MRIIIEDSGPAQSGNDMVLQALKIGVAEKLEEIKSAAEASQVELERAKQDRDKALELAAETAQKCEKLVADLAAVTMERDKLNASPWRFPKRGDKVKIVKSMNDYEAFKDSVFNARVGSVHTVQCAGAVQTEPCASGKDWKEKSMPAVVITVKTELGNVDEWHAVECLQLVETA